MGNKWLANWIKSSPTCNGIVLFLKIERFDMSIKKEMEKLIQAERKKLKIEGKLD